MVSCLLFFIESLYEMPPKYGWNVFESINNSTTIQQPSLLSSSLVALQLIRKFYIFYSKEIHLAFLV